MWLCSVSFDLAHTDDLYEWWMTKFGNACVGFVNFVFFFQPMFGNEGGLLSSARPVG